MNRPLYKKEECDCGRIKNMIVWKDGTTVFYCSWCDGPGRPDPPYEVEMCELCDEAEGQDRHHTSYYPEETMLLCKACHMRIHHEDGFHDELEPGIARPEDYESNAV